jgi:hypothetical protein
MPDLVFIADYYSNRILSYVPFKAFLGVFYMVFYGHKKVHFLRLYKSAYWKPKKFLKIFLILRVGAPIFSLRV